MDVNEKGKPRTKPSDQEVWRDLQFRTQCGDELTNDDVKELFRIADKMIVKLYWLNLEVAAMNILHDDHKFAEE